MTDRVGTNELLVTICGQVEARLATALTEIGRPLSLVCEISQLVNKSGVTRFKEGWGCCEGCLVRFRLSSCTDFSS